MTDIHELEQAWRDEPGNLNTFFALEERYREAQRWGELIRLFSEGPDDIRATEDFGSRHLDVRRSFEAD